MMFMKAPSAVIGPGADIVCPKMSRRVDYEAELAVVMGRRAKAVPAARAPDYVLGYTCLNDVTARDLQAKDGQWTRAKGFDTFCPLGPAIVTDADPADLAVEAWLNGERKQASRTSNLVFDVPALIEAISAVYDLGTGRRHRHGHALRRGRHRPRRPDRSPDRGPRLAHQPGAGRVTTRRPFDRRMAGLPGADTNSSGEIRMMKIKPAERLEKLPP